MIRLQITAAAKRDLVAAKDFYASQGIDRLDLRFAQAFEDSVERIESFPQGYSVVLKDVRRAQLKTFPYSVFYRPVSESAWQVIAVAHHSRDPRIWKGRA